MSYCYLLAAITMEVIATVVLKNINHFTNWAAALLVASGDASAYYCFSLALRTLPLGLAYATWSGMGIMLVALIGSVSYGQRLDFPALLGISLILAGIVILNLFSYAVSR